MDDRRGAALRYIAQDAPTGYGESADRLVRALREAGVRVEYRRYVGEVRGEVPDIRQHRRDPRSDEWAMPGAPTVAHLVPEHYEHVRRLLGEHGGGGGPLIAHTVWETDRMPDHWPALLNAVDRIVVPTEWNRGVFTEGGVTAPITVLPHIACDPTLGDGGVPLGLPDDVVVFYTISRWDQRKQPAAVIRAFAEAFTAADPVALVVKTTPTTQFPIPGEWGGASGILGTTMLEVARILRDYPSPPVVRGEIEEWAPARIAGLHTRCDCFVSLTHAEGWDLGAFDAATYGNPVIATGWGGPLSYLDADASFLVDVDLVPVEHFERHSYSPKQHWAEPRLDHAVELLREVAADLGAARRRALLQRDRLRADYAPARVVEILREGVPELDLPAPSRPARSPGPGRIPRIAHYVFGFKNPPDPFHLVHALAIESCLDVVRPDAVHLHARTSPAGPAWDRVADRIELHEVGHAPAVHPSKYSDLNIYRYAYAHHADFIRLDVLAERGGLYADLDTLFVATIPDECWDAPFVIGREADVADPDGGAPRPALSNAVMLARPGSAFVEAWRSEMAEALDGSWAAHSCFLAKDLAERMPADVRIEPQRVFHAFEPSPEGIALLLEHPPPELDGVVALHLAAHLWWDEDRRDFSDVHGDQITEDWIRSSPSTYATLARRFLRPA